MPHPDPEHRARGRRPHWPGVLAVLLGVGLIAGGAVSAATLVPAGASRPVAPTFPSLPRTPGAGARPLEPLLRHAGRTLTLPAGTYTVPPFGPDLIGLAVPPEVQRITGAGAGRTVLAMPAHASRRAEDVPTRLWRTNQLSELKVTGSPVLSGFTLQGTDQGHLYNGLRMHRTVDARVTDVHVALVPGDDDVPPGETFGINDYRTTGSVYRRIEVDGSGVGASGFATNSSRDVTVVDSSFHDQHAAHGATFWQTEAVALTDVRAEDNAGAGLNFERDSGLVTITRPVLDGNRVADLRIASDRGSARFRIVDPVLRGARLVIDLPAEYGGAPNRQRQADIRVLVHGVDRTAELVRFVDRG